MLKGCSTVLRFLRILMLVLLPRRQFVTCFLGHSRTKQLFSPISTIPIKQSRVILVTLTGNPKSVHATTTTSTATHSELVDNWRDHPALNRTLVFPTWIVPNESLATILSSSLLHPYLANQWDLLEHIHPRIKMVQTVQNQKLLLRHPHNDPNDDVKKWLDQQQVTEGPDWELSVTYQRWSVPYILQNLLPPHLHPPPTAYEQVGSIAHLNLIESHLPFRKLIGQVLVECVPVIDTVVQKVGPVQGPHRTYPLEVLAGRNSTKVTVVEGGVSVSLDLQDVYWCSRLSGERARLLKLFRDGDWIADVFCGVGMQLLQAAKRYPNCQFWANDWNPKAIHGLQTTIQHRHLQSQFVSVTCGDGYDFLVDIGLNASSSESLPRLPNHVLMNFPLEAPRFLAALRWWPSHFSNPKAPRVHLYTFARATTEQPCVEEVAVDLVAAQLVPEIGATEVTVGRRRELDEMWGCQVETRQVRDVAPGKVVVYVGLSVTSKLLRHMQGDF